LNEMMWGRQLWEQ